MYYVLFGVHLLIAFLICVVVLLQRSKGGGLAGAFGGVGAGEAAFGSHGVTTFLHKTTIYLAIGFMATSLTLAYMTASRSENRGAVAGPQETVLPVGSSPTVPAEGVEPEGAEATGAGDDIVPVIGEDAPEGETGAAADTVQGGGASGTGGAAGGSNDTQGGGGN